MTYHVNKTAAFLIELEMKKKPNKTNKLIYDEQININLTC